MSANSPTYRVIDIGRGLSPRASSFNLLTASKKLQSVLNFDRNVSWKSYLLMLDTLWLHEGHLSVFPLFCSVHMFVKNLFVSYCSVSLNSFSLTELCSVFRSLSAMAGWIKYLLTSEQKKSDFRPETEEGPLQMFSTVSFNRL